MRRDGHIVSVGNVGDALALQDAAGLGQVGHDHVHGLTTEQLEKVEPRVLVLAGADHGAGRGPHLGQRFDVLGGDRLFQPHQAQVFDRLAQGDRRGQVEMAVAVDGQVDLVPDRLAHALDQADDVRHFLGPGGPVVPVQLAHAAVIDVEFDRRIALALDDLERLLGIGLRVVGLAGVAVGIEADSVPELAAKQPVHGHAQRLPGDVVQRIVDARQGKDEWCIGRTGVAPEPAHRLIDRPHVEGVLADQPTLHEQDGMFETKPGANAGRVALAGADDPLVGIDAHKGPDAAPAVTLVASDDAGLYVGDFH